MIIQKAVVRTKLKKDPGTVTLTLVELEDGWTYEADSLLGDPIPLLWRTQSAEAASKKLTSEFKEEYWDLSVVEKQAEI